MFEQVRINGSYYHDGAYDRLNKLNVGDELFLEREPGNTHDANAIKVLDRGGGMLGYVAAGNGKNIILAQLMDAGQEVRAEVSQKSASSTYINVFTPDDEEEESIPPDLIRLVQIPVIEEKLRTLSAEIDSKVEYAKGLVCNEDTVKIVKEVRASLNREFDNFEAQRKLIKLAIMEPYEAFEDVYKKHVATKYKEADKELAEKINSTESELKGRKAEEVKEYFDELCRSLKIDFVKFEDMRLKVNLSTSVKSLKTQVDKFLKKISSDMEVISTLDEALKADVMVEFKRNGFDAGSAAITVTERNRARRLEAEKAKALAEQKALEEEKRAAMKAAAGVPEVMSPPKVQTKPQAEEKKFALSFKVIGTKQELMELKAFLTTGGYTYESIK